MDSYSQVITNIIKVQSNIIGPVAMEQAQGIDGLEITSLDKIKITGTGKEIITSLVSRYVKLFGPASLEVCKEAVQEMRPPVSDADLPDILK